MGGKYEPEGEEKAKEHKEWLDALTGRGLVDGMADDEAVKICGCMRELTRSSVTCSETPKDIKKQCNRVILLT